MSYCLHEAPTIQRELVEEFWRTAEFAEGTNEISFICKGKSYTITSALLGKALRLSENSCSALVSDENIRMMLDETNYALTPSTVNLGEIVKKKYRREWSYFFDSIIKVFSGKISNFDAITIAMQLIANSLLYDQYFNLSNVIINELRAKLGKLATRANKIYFSRFIKLCINHLVNDVVLENAEDQLTCWIQSKRVFMELVTLRD